MDTTNQTLSELTIIQFNCNHSNHKGIRPFFNSLNPKNQHIIAIQESERYTKNGSTYCPYGYSLAMPIDPDTHVAFLVSNELRMANWQLKTHSPHLASLVLNLAESKAQIFNSYVPSSTISRDTTTAVLLEARRAIAEMLTERESENNNQEAEKSILYQEDFNLHHSE